MAKTKRVRGCGQCREGWRVKTIIASEGHSFAGNEYEIAVKCECQRQGQVVREHLKTKMRHASMADREIAAAFAPWSLSPSEYSTGVIEGLQELAQWAKGETKDPPWAWLLLSQDGRNGNGKTHAAAQVAREWLAAERGTLEWASSVRDSERAILGRMGDQRGELENRWIAARLLIIDDLGAEGGRETRRELWNQILTERERHNRLTLATSNAATAQELFDERLYSRYQGAEVLVMDGPDFRAVRKTSV